MGKFVGLKVLAETKKNVKRIAAETGEKDYEVVDRIAKQEIDKIRKKD